MRQLVTIFKNKLFRILCISLSGRFTQKSNERQCNSSGYVRLCTGSNGGATSEVFIRVPDVALGSVLLGLVLLDFGHYGVLPRDGVHVARSGVGSIVVVA